MILTISTSQASSPRCSNALLDQRVTLDRRGIDCLLKIDRSRGPKTTPAKETRSLAAAFLWLSPRRPDPRQDSVAPL